MAKRKYSEKEFATKLNKSQKLIIEAARQADLPGFEQIYGYDTQVWVLNSLAAAFSEIHQALGRGDVPGSKFAKYMEGEIRLP